MKKLFAGILNYRKPGFWVAAAVLAAGVGLWAALLVNHPAADPQEYSGLTREEHDELTADRDRYEAMTPEQRGWAMEGGNFSCREFRHLSWEHTFDMSLIDYAGVPAFEQWIAQQPEGQCCTIYDFAKRFGLDCELLERLTQSFAPPERLRARAVQYGVRVIGQEECQRAALAHGLSPERARRLEEYGVPRIRIMELTPETEKELLEDLNGSPELDQKIQGWFDAGFQTLAEAGEGAYYNRKTNQLVNARMVEDYCRASERLENQSLLYFVDDTREPFIYRFRSPICGGYAVDRYRRDGTKETFRSRSAGRYDTRYKFGGDLYAAGFPLSIPKGSGSPQREAELQELYDRYLDPLARSEMLEKDWSDPGTISPESFMAYYVAVHGQRSNPMEAPRARVEAAILQDFDIPVRRLRAAVNYDEAKEAYIFGNRFAAANAPRLVDYRQENGKLTLEFEFYSREDGTTITRAGKVLLQVDGEPYKYLSCSVWPVA